MNLPTKFTPGPWNAGFSHQGAFRVYAGSMDDAIVANCNVVGGVATGLEAAANTSLIAAAPDLYKELAHIVSLLEPMEESGSLQVPGRATRNAARAALAKARGEESGGGE